MGKIVSSMEELQARTKAVAPDVVHSDYKELDIDKVSYNDFNDVAVKGPVQYVCDGYWSEIHEADQTYAGVIHAMQVSINRTHDRHHVFFEGFRVTKQIANVLIVEIYMGS